MVKPPETLDRFESFTEIVRALRGPDGCPWDKEQTHRTLTPYAIEEAYELVEAIEADDDEELVGELGDVLLQVVLHSEIARQEGRFSITDVIQRISEKMVRRHPHVFSTTEVGSAHEVLNNWSEIKAAEKKAKAERRAKAGLPQAKAASPFAFEIPRQLPALQRSQKIGDKTQRLGFDWPNVQGVVAKLDEEVGETKTELARLGQKTKQFLAPADVSAEIKKALEHEIGDVLFSTAQLARHVGLEAEQCLREANSRFEARYVAMREAVEASGQDWSKLTDDDKEAAWQAAKKKLAESADKKTGDSL